MNFTSFHFLAFFFVTIVIGHLLKNRSQRIFLLLASYYFYGVFEPWYLILIITSTFIDYVAGLGIQAGRDAAGKEPASGDRERAGSLPGFLALLPPRLWLFLSLAMNLGLLGYFKYTNFGIQVFNDVQYYGDTILAWPSADILLPIGISFYTFQSLSYTIDVYRGILTPRRNIVDFALYVAFFPQLVAGPIVRATTFLERLDNRPAVTREDIVIGVTRIVVGFFRKLVLSDNLAILVNQVFASPQDYGPVDIWLASIGFGFQIYLDFAGYTDIARGTARLFGFEFEINFLYPMASRNITQHWQRWHISLTTWMRDYLYIPLGGSRVGPVRLYLNNFIVWFLVGLWHGAAYHFVAWGVWQAVMIGIHRFYSRTKFHDWLHRRGGFVYGGFARLLTIFSLNFGFIWFRAPTMQKAAFMHGREFGLYDLPGIWSHGLVQGKAACKSFAACLGGPTGFALPGLVFPGFIAVLALYFVYEYIMDALQLEYFWREENRGKLVLFLIFMIFCIITLSSPDSPNFMYFQF